MEVVTWNPLDKDSTWTLSSDLLTATPNKSYGSVRATKYKTKGRWYWEVTVTSGEHIVGVANKNMPISNYGSDNTQAKGLYRGQFVVYPYDASNIYNNFTLTSNLTIGVLLDVDNRKIAFVTSQGTGSFVDLGISGDLAPFISNYNGTGQMTANFGATPFVYNVPSGFRAYGEDIKNKTLILHDGEYKKWSESGSHSSIETILKNPVVPAMTGNSQNNIVISSDSNSSNTNEPYILFDKKTGLVGDWLKNATQDTWIKVSLNQVRHIGAYSIQCYSSSMNSTDRYMVKKWMLYASNDDMNWDLIDERNEMNWSFLEIRNFKTNAKKAYKFYRFNFPLPNNGDTIIALGEIQLYEETSPSIAHWTVHQSIQTEGMDSLSPLLDRRIETLEPLPMTNKSGILQANEEGKMFSKTVNLKKYIDLRNIKVEVE